MAYDEINSKPILLLYSPEYCDNKVIHSIIFLAIITRNHVIELKMLVRNYV